jgi:hypothetical protein
VKQQQSEAYASDFLDEAPEEDTQKPNKSQESHETPKATPNAKLKLMQGEVTHQAPPSDGKTITQDNPGQSNLITKVATPLAESPGISHRQN